MVVLDIDVPNWIKHTVVLRGEGFPDLRQASLERLIENEASRQPQSTLDSSHLQMKKKYNWSWCFRSYLTLGNWWGCLGAPETEPSVTNSALHICFCNLCPLLCRNQPSEIASASTLPKSLPSREQLLSLQKICSLPWLALEPECLPGERRRGTKQRIRKIFICLGFPLCRLNYEPHYFQARKLKCFLSINMSWVQC